MKKLAAILFLIFQSMAWATIPHQGTISSINLGLRYSSILQRRGVVSYGDFQVDPVLSAFFFDDHLEFLGDSLDYRDFFVDESVRYRFKISTISDNPLFPAYDSVKSNYFDREDSYEISAGLEFFLESYTKDYWGEIDISGNKDLKAHQGYYLDVQGKLKLSQFKIFNKLIEPHAIMRVGWGDEKHNKYFYGPSANADGVNNWAYGIWLEFPLEADRAFPIIQLMRFQTLGENRQNAAYAKDHNEGYLLSFIATVGLLE